METGSEGEPAAAPGEGFWRGVWVGAVGALAVGFVLLGLWFRSEEGAPYRFMLGEQARRALDARAPSSVPPPSVEASDPVGLASPPSPAYGPRSRGPTPYPPALLPAPVYESADVPPPPGYTVYPAGSGAQPWPANARSFRLYGRPVRRPSTPSATPREPAPNGAVSAGGSAAIAQEAPAPSGSVDSDAPLPVPPVLRSLPGQRASSQDPSRNPPSRNSSGDRSVRDLGIERDLGIDDLMETQRRNREVIGRASSLLRALRGAD